MDIEPRAPSESTEEQKQPVPATTRKENVYQHYKPLMAFIVKQFTFDAVPLSEYQKIYTDDPVTTLKNQIKYYQKLILQCARETENISSEEEMFQYLVNSDAFDMTTFFADAADRIMDMSNPDLMQAFDKENKPRKPLYFDPDFSGTVSFNNNGIEMEYKTFKDKVYPKVMMGSIRKIIRMMLITQRIFYLLKPIYSTTHEINLVEIYQTALKSPYLHTINSISLSYVQIKAQQVINQKLEQIRHEYEAQIKANQGNADDIYNDSVLKLVSLKTHIADFKFHETFAKQMEEETKEHKKQDPSNCSICDVHYEDVIQLIDHYRFQHQKDAQFQCQECQFFTKEGEELSEHMISTHHQQVGPLCTYLELKVSKKTFTCLICQAELESNMRLKDHIRLEHGQKIVFQCTQCDLKLKNAKTLSEHCLRDHSKVFVCKFTKKEFDDAETLKDHINSNPSYLVYRKINF